MMARKPAERGRVKAAGARARKRRGDVAFLAPSQAAATDSRRRLDGGSGMERIVRGGCLCGGVAYAVSGPLRQVVACHCTQCRKTSGHYVAATQADAADVAISATTLSWYRSSQEAERGFCARCGSNLFWRRPGRGKISIFAGTIDGPTGLRMESQLYCASAGDYYDLPEVPEIAQSGLG